ncbi:MAG TPA: hypothetical protein VF043_39080 [Ktedonobacteraceae bacterium]
MAVSPGMATGVISNGDSVRQDTAAERVTIARPPPAPCASSHNPPLNLARTMRLPARPARAEEAQALRCLWLKELLGPVMFVSHVRKTEPRFHSHGLLGH